MSRRHNPRTTRPNETSWRMCSFCGWYTPCLPIGTGAHACGACYEVATIMLPREQVTA